MLQFVLPNGVVNRPLSGLETAQFAGAIVAWSVLCLSGIALITPKQLMASKARPGLLLAIAAILFAGLTNETYAITGLLEAPRVAFEEATLNLTVWFYELSGRPTPHLSFDDGVPTMRASGFAILIGQSCMGYQGVASASVLLGSYIAIEWRRLNVARAVCLVVAAVVATFVLNSARIAMLFYIGEEISPEVAVNGFHSNFGTFALFLISFVSIMSMEFSFFRRGTGQTAKQASSRDHSVALAGAAKFMFPLTVYLVSAMVIGLFSGEFNWFYPAPVAVGCMTLWIMRQHFTDVFAQRVNPEGVLAGMLAFAIWVALIPVDAERHTLLTGTLTEAPMWLAAVWVVFRVFGSSIVVPIVEELAFRGGLQPVLQDIIPESCPNHLRTILAVLGSAIAFGLLHSDILAGILVGILYGGVVWRTGKVLDAIVAHAITNFLICVLVLAMTKLSVTVMRYPTEGNCGPSEDEHPMTPYCLPLDTSMLMAAP